MIETFRNINQQNNQGDRPLINCNTNPLTNTQTIVKKYAKNRNLAEELIAERRRESINE
jgi:predicted proteasome-type protease